MFVFVTPNIFVKIFELFSAKLFCEYVRCLIFSLTINQLNLIISGFAP